MKRLWALTPLLIFAALAFAFGAMLLRGGGERGFSQNGLVGAAAPAYALERLDGGEKLTSQTYAGKPHLVNFFASWCVPCRQEHPMLEKMAAAGIVIVGVDYKDAPASARALLVDLGNPYAVVGLDSDGRTGLDYGVTGVPETFVIGADGKIVATHRGPIDDATVRNKIEPALRR
jgi:cytochrome c biogenesis protein CcmG/thiol:disulfide interchange protein DsbE